ncbi:protein LIAT1 [Spinachia spinachia]
MPEDQQRTLLRAPGSCEGTKKKRKKRPKVTASATERADEPQDVSLPPETSTVSLPPPKSPGQPRGQLPKLTASSRRSGERLRRSQQRPKDSAAPLQAAHQASGNGQLGAQARESLRWEGVLEDPRAEEKRLELYRARRRQRYVAHRDAVLVESQGALRQPVP